MPVCSLWNLRKSRFFDFFVFSDSMRVSKISTIKILLWMGETLKMSKKTGKVNIPIGCYKDNYFWNIGFLSSSILFVKSISLKVLHFANIFVPLGLSYHMRLFGFENPNGNATKYATKCVYLLSLAAWMVNYYYNIFVFFIKFDDFSTILKIFLD